MTQAGQGDEGLTISIDGLPYRVGRGVMSGAEIRQIPHPPIPDDRDLWLAEDDGRDRFLDDGTDVTLREGVRFFTAPRSILAG